MSSALFQQFYREILSDLSVSREENDDIKQKFVDANPPPDKLIWLRSTAFRIGSDFLTEEHDQNVSLLRSINVIVHALETTCMR
jgi:poly(U)-specific endoribonuclease